MAQNDTFICGTCQDTFHDINLFIVHKNEQCVALKAEDGEGQVIYAALQEGQDIADAHIVTEDQIVGRLRIGSELSQEDNMIMKEVPQEGMVISEDQVNETDKQMCLIEINETEPTTEIHLVPLQQVLKKESFAKNQFATMVTTADGDIRLVLSEDGQQSVDQAKPPRRRPGRPRKGEEKNPKITPIKKDTERANPEVDENGTLRCPRCMKTFRKQRHFTTHHCLATTDYVDTLKREVLSPDEASDDEDEEEGEKQDKSVNFKFASTTPRRGRPPKFRTTHQVVADTELAPSAELANMIVPAGEMTVMAAAEVQPGALVDESAGGDGLGDRSLSKRGRPRSQDSLKWDMELPVSKDQISNIPVFADEEEKLAFEESLNVEFTQVDDMYKTHVIDQNVNEYAPPPASRTSNELSVFSCNVCDKVFKTVSHMRLHCLTHTNIKPFKCTKCSYGSNSKGNLYTHMRIHTGQFYTCPACNFQTPNKTHLVEHMATHSKVRHKCAICKKDYNTLKSMMNHVRKYHLSKAGKDYLEKFQGKHNQGTAVLHQCHICLRKFKKRIDRDRHLFVHNIRGLPNIHECDLCDYTTSRRRYLEGHFQKHRVVYICAECNNKFPSSVRLSYHLNQVHGVSESSENWMQVFQACIASSLFLPEPDGSTDTLFSDGVGEIENATNILEVKDCGDLNAAGIVQEEQGGIMMIEPVRVLEVDTDVPVIRDGQTVEQLVQTNGVDGHTEMVLVPNENEVGSVDITEQAEANQEQMQVAEEGQQVMDSVEAIGGSQLPEYQGQVGDGEIGDDIDDHDIEGMEDLEAINVEDYNIYKRLNYSQMSWDVFHKFRATYGSEECEFCGRLFYSKSDFNTHFRSHTGERPFACDQCTYRASTKDALKRHIEKEHDKVTYVCQQCDFVASSRTQLWHHQQRHKEPQELTCTTCDITFPSAKRLKAHLSVRHPTMDKALVKKMLSVCQKPKGKFGRRSHKCPYCAKTFMRGSADLQKHIWIHQGIKPFKCTLCTHACRSKNNLMSHMMRHSSEKPFSCTDCGKAYKSRTALRWHVRTHKDGKIFRCVKCSYEAVQYSHLKRHMQTHDVVKRFVCQHCNYSANTIGYMKIHYTRHHKGQEYRENPNPVPQMAPGTKVYRCLSCDYLFGNLSDIKRHLKVRHHVSVEDIHALDNIEADQPQTVELPSGAEGIMLLQEGTEIQHPGTVVMQQEDVVAGEQVVSTVDITAPQDVMQHEPQSEVQVVEMMQPPGQVVATSEEQDASSALQALQFSVPQGSMDPQTASAVSILQQIIGMSKQGAFTGQQHITVQAEDGQSYVAVNPDTIIVQQDSDELVIAGDGQEGEQQYVIQYVTQPPPDGISVMEGGEQEVGVDEVVANTEVVTDEQHQQVIEMHMSDQYNEDHVVHEGMDAILAAQRAGLQCATEQTLTIQDHTIQDHPMEVAVEAQSLQVVHCVDSEQNMPVPMYTDVEQETTVEEHIVTSEIVTES